MSAHAEASITVRAVQWVLQISLGIFLFCNMAGGEPMQANIVDATAKLVFSRDAQGVVQALVIPHKSDGHFPRSGWILCGIEGPALRDEFERRLGDKERLEGYFRVRYRVTGKDASSPILQYLGLIEDISPWEPGFPSKSK